MTRLRCARWAFVAVMALVAVMSSGCGLRAEPMAREGATVFAVGDCVEIPAGSPASPGTLKAAKTGCGADPSYTVGATTDSSGSCPSNEYQHLPTHFADPSTSRLCLVPNLVADHCYVLDMPIGVVQRADCSDRRQAGLLVQVTQRLDVRDQQACPSDVGEFAWPYPSPPR
ncbi:MAG: hypothetical protein QOF88_3061, partial [Mycobacterium sp.]|nr:hypothetical protein [Mycobacterium sp.]